MMHGRSTTAEAKERAGFVLGVSADATDEEALAAYQHGVATLHPRVGGDHRAYQALLAAWAVWQQLSEADAGSPMSLAQAAELRAEGIRRDAPGVSDTTDALEALEARAAVVLADPAEDVVRIDHDDDVVLDLRDQVYEVNLEAIAALPAAYRAYAVAGDAAVIRTAAGLVRDYA